MDFRELSSEQHRAAHRVFDQLQGRQFLPFDQIDEDESRAILDRLTGLSAEVGPGGVALSWTVDESRAHCITGFTCVYLSNVAGNHAHQC